MFLHIEKLCMIKRLLRDLYIKELQDPSDVSCDFQYAFLPSVIQDVHRAERGEKSFFRVFGVAIILSQNRMNLSAQDLRYELDEIPALKSGRLACPEPAIG